MDYELGTMDHGLWSMVYGPFFTDFVPVDSQGFFPLANLRVAEDSNCIGRAAASQTRTDYN